MPNTFRERWKGWNRVLVELKYLVGEVLNGHFRIIAAFEWKRHAERYLEQVKEERPDGQFFMWEAAENRPRRRRT